MHWKVLAERFCPQGILPHKNKTSKTPSFQIILNRFRCTENFNVRTAQLSIFGVPLWYKSNTPRTVISPAVQPGECWAFQGFPGFLVLKLNHNVFVTGFTVEHIPKSLSPNGNIDSAPKLFTVWVSLHF